MSNNFKKALSDLSRMNYNGAVMIDGLCKEFLKEHRLAIEEALTMCSTMREKQIKEFYKKSNEYFENV